MRSLFKKKSKFALPSSSDVSLTFVPCPGVTVVEHKISSYNFLVVIDRRWRRERGRRKREQKLIKQKWIRIYIVVSWILRCVQSVGSFVTQGTYPSNGERSHPHRHCQRWFAGRRSGYCLSSVPYGSHRPWADEYFHRQSLGRPEDTFAYLTHRCDSPSTHPAHVRRTRFQSSRPDGSLSPLWERVENLTSHRSDSTTLIEGLDCTPWRVTDPAYFLTHP